MKCEAILISGGSAVAVDEKDKENRVAKLYLEEWIQDVYKDTSKYEFFDILWMESWGKAISCMYRKALGRVWKQHSSERLLKR